MKSRLDDRLIAITGKPEWPGMGYVAEKAVKYLRDVPRVWLRARWREMRNHEPDATGKTFLFIGGLHRSGTSVLHRLIRAHPDVSGISGTTVPEDEGQFLQSVYPPDRQYGMLFADHVSAHLTEASDLVNEVNRRRLLRDWGRYMDFARPVLVEKSPSNLLRMRFLDAMVPDARFILIVRHPVAAALAVRKWTDAPVERIVEHWCRAHLTALQDMERLGAALVVRYEDMVASPLREYTRCIDFAGLEPVAVRETLTDGNGVYFDRWMAEMPVSVAACERIEAEHETLLARFGYRLGEPFVEMS